jgi:hypothetical protein
MNLSSIKYGAGSHQNGMGFPSAPHDTESGNNVANIPLVPQGGVRGSNAGLASLHPQSTVTGGYNVVHESQNENQAVAYNVSQLGDVQMTGTSGIGGAGEQGAFSDVFFLI